MPYSNLGKLADEPCAKCGSHENVVYTGSMTMYTYEGELGGPDDPNKPIPLCKEDAEEYTAHMQDQWDEYYRGLI